MKKIILLSILFIIGCEKDSPTGSGVNPLVGVWEGSEINYDYSDGTSVTYTLGENMEMGTMTWIFGEDGVTSMIAKAATETYTNSGTWSATGNKLTIIPTSTNDGEETMIFDFIISGNLLTINDEYVGTSDGEISFTTEIRLIKQ